jgi:abortive infection bacteriophage resistance protein
LEDIKSQIGHAPEASDRRDVYIQHYYDRYDSPDMPPCWMVFQSVSFGIVSKTYKNLAYPDFNLICKPLGLNHTILTSWLHSISHVRNICAHHSRLWNREFRIKPIEANAYKRDLKPNDRVYAQLVVMQILLQKIVPGNHWGLKLRDLLAEHPNIPLPSMGFPADWLVRPIWGFTK